MAVGVTTGDDWTETVLTMGVMAAAEAKVGAAAGVSVTQADNMANHPVITSKAKNGVFLAIARHSHVQVSCFRVFITLPAN